MNKIENTSSRLTLLMNERGLKQVDVMKLVKPICAKYNVNFAKSTLSQYITGKYEPDSEKIIILSEAFNVQPSWLLGYDVERDNVSIEKVSEDEFVNELKELINKNIPDEKKKMIKKMIITLLDEEK